MAITRFRIEAKGHDKEALTDEIAQAAAKLIRLASENELQPAGEWECTDDVVTGNEKHGYKARMVLKLNEDIVS